MPKARCGLGLRWMSKPWESSKSSSSRMAEVYYIATLSPGLMVTPCNVVSAMAVRRK